MNKFGSRLVLFESYLQETLNNYKIVTARTIQHEMKRLELALIVDNAIDEYQSNTFEPSWGRGYTSKICKSYFMAMMEVLAKYKAKMDGQRDKVRAMAVYIW